MMAMALFVLLSLPSADAPWLQYGGYSRDFTVSGMPSPTSFTLLWKTPLGPGTSGVVTDGKLLYTLHSTPDAKNKGKGCEFVTAFDAKTGKQIWQQKKDVARLSKQESFSGDPIRPQATPALLDGKLCCLGYTGLLTCYDAATGKELWNYDLVKDLGATPVQFGFASSPLIYGDSFIVHPGGRTSLVRLEASSGKIMWKAEAGESSYASPVLAPFFGKKQIVQSTRDYILGIDPETGATLWKYAMPEPGLTNVPTSLPLPGDRLLVSGQGIKGTRLLQLSTLGDQISINELWHNSKTPFFYCNFHVHDGKVIGNSSKLLVALNAADGKELWRERGYTDSNQLCLGSDFLILAGDGQLSRCRFSDKGIERTVTSKLLSGRCWTAPTLAGSVLYVRNQEQLYAIGCE